MSTHFFSYSGNVGKQTIETTYKSNEDTWIRVLYEFAKHLGHAYGYSIVEKIKVNDRPIQDEAYRY